MKQFDIITEADARTLDIGATVELDGGGHVTPLARDTLAARRVTVIPARVHRTNRRCPRISRRPRHPARGDWMRSHRAGDEAGLVEHLRGRGLAVIDVGHRHVRAGGLPGHRGAVAVSVSRGESRRRHRRSTARGSDRRSPRTRCAGIRAAMCRQRNDRALFARAQRRQRA